MYYFIKGRMWWQDDDMYTTPDVFFIVSSEMHVASSFCIVDVSGCQQKVLQCADCQYETHSKFRFTYVYWYSFLRKIVGKWQITWNKIHWAIGKIMCSWDRQCKKHSNPISARKKRINTQSQPRVIWNIRIYLQIPSIQALRFHHWPFSLSEQLLGKVWKVVKSDDIPWPFSWGSTIHYEKLHFGRYRRVFLSKEGITVIQRTQNNNSTFSTDNALTVLRTFSSKYISFTVKRGLFEILPLCLYPPDVTSCKPYFRYHNF